MSRPIQQGKFYYSYTLNNLMFSFAEHPLSVTWCDKTWLNYLNQQNVLDYFAERSNPFYDHECNNEVLRMRGVTISNANALQQLHKMQGIEYTLLHVQEPILYVIRKQKRSSPTMTTTLGHYYIIAGVVYQAPDMQTIIQSRLLSTIHYLQSAFDECFNYARFHPSTDYSWDFENNADNNLANIPSNETDSSNKDSKDKKQELTHSESKELMLRGFRVEALINELVRKFPLKTNATNTANINNNITETNETDCKTTGENTNGDAPSSNN